MMESLPMKYIVFAVVISIGMITSVHPSDMAPQRKSRASFVLECEDGRTGFAAVTGLDSRQGSTGYRGADTGTRRLPGLQATGNITLKMGVAKSGQPLLAWLAAAAAGGAKRRSLVLTQFDGRGQVVRAWRIRNAFPVKFVAPGFQATGNDVAIETLELAHEGLEPE